MKIVCLNTSLNGTILLTIVVLFTYNGTGYCVNSMEREVREIRGTDPVIKSWLVFVKRRVLVCGQNGNSMLGIFNFLSCFSNEGNRKDRCLDWESARCRIVERGGNALHFKSLYTRRPLHLRVDVNRIFSLNLSFTKLHLGNNKKWSYDNMNYMDLRIGKKSQRHTKDRLPWTIISMHTSAMISIKSRDYGLYIAFEYSVTEKLNHEYTYQYGTYHLNRDFFQMEIVRIAVETIYRIHVEITGCFRCKVIAHDGPHAIFPTILRQIIGPRGFTSFSTSAHYSLVFMTNETLFNTTVIHYDAVLVVYNTFTLSRPIQLMFDNNTRCNDYISQVRSCVFEIRAPGDSNVKLTLTEIQVKGVYAGNDFAAGFVVYNVVGGKLGKVSEFLESNTYFPARGIPFTSTESTMYVVIFAYSGCASIFAQAVATVERCNGMFVKMNRPTTTVVVHFDNCTNIKCFRVQTIPLSRRKNYSMKLSIHINTNTTVLVELGYVTLYRDTNLCLPNLFHNLQDSQQGNSEKTNYRSYVGKIRKLDWHCSPVTKIIITEIKTAACVLPCRLLFNTEGIKPSNLPCNACKFKYLGGLKTAINLYKRINRTTQIDLHIYSPLCATVDLLFLIDPTSTSDFIRIDVRRNQSFSIASPLGVYMRYEGRCIIRLPRHALPTENYRTSETQTMREPINSIWGGNLYRAMRSDQFVSWTYTARECQKYGGYLLVIHNQMEYHHIEYLMRKFAIGILYIGWKRKVKLKPLSIVL